MNTSADPARARRRKGLSRSTGVTVGVAAAGGVGSLVVAAGLALSHADSVAATVPAVPVTGSSSGAGAPTGASGNGPTAAATAPSGVPTAGVGAGVQAPQQQPGQGQVAPGGGSQPQAQSAGS